MPYITVPEPIPGIRGLLNFKPEIGRPFSELAEQLLRGRSSLTQGERELIAAYVSSLNQCRYCTGAHTAAAAHCLNGDYGLVEAVKLDPETAALDDKMRALLRIAAKVQADARTVTAEDVAAAREAGADDEAVHDTVLVAAAFCMANRYVDGLAAIVPDEPEVFDQHGWSLANKGYLWFGPSAEEPLEVTPPAA